MTKLSRTVLEIEESQTLAFTLRAGLLAQAGADIISLTAGEPDFPTPQHVKDAAARAIAEDFTHYTANQGTAELLDAVREKFSRDNGLTYSPDQILVSSGAKHSVYNALQAICNDGDEVIILSPYWVSYPAIVRLAGARPVVVATRAEDSFQPDVEKIRAAMTRATKAIILNSPSNPTGAVYTREVMEGIASLAQEHGTFVISDEIYEKVTFDGARHWSPGAFAGMEDLVITVNGLSKAYAMTGWRIGFLGGPREAVSAAARVQGHSTGNANSIAQKAAIAALRGPEDSVQAMTMEFQRRRDAVVTILRASGRLGVPIPSGAMYCFVDVSRYFGGSWEQGTITSSYDAAAYLLEGRHVATVPGKAFGDDRYLRLSFACPIETARAGARRIVEGLEQLR